MEELLKLTKENNIMLKQILLYLNMKESNNYQDSKTMKEFIINVIANMSNI